MIGVSLDKKTNFDKIEKWVWYPYYPFIKLNTVKDEYTGIMDGLYVGVAAINISNILK